MAEIPNPFEVTEPVQTEQAKHRLQSAMMKNRAEGTPNFLMVTGSEADDTLNAANVMKLGRYVNPDLTSGSDYFRSLDSMMKCVEKNAWREDVESQQQVCAKEFRNMRLAAYNNKLLYSEVNRRFFMIELEYQRNYSGY